MQLKFTWKSEDPRNLKSDLIYRFTDLPIYRSLYHRNAPFYFSARVYCTLLPTAVINCRFIQSTRNECSAQEHSFLWKSKAQINEIRPIKKWQTNLHHLQVSRNLELSPEATTSPLLGNRSAFSSLPLDLAYTYFI